MARTKDAVLASEQKELMEKGHALSQAHRLGCQYTTAT
jgi:hypothetical protein